MFFRYHGRLQLIRRVLGLSAMLGMASQVGVIGHLIGGGLGLSVGERGLALDNLISAKVVLANGDIVTANEAEHSDLFWAIRGGGSNFGAIVEIAIKLHDQRRDVYSCTFVYAPEKLQDVFKEVIEWRKTQATDELIFLVLTLCPEGTPVLALNARKNSDFASGEASFSRFGKLAPLANMPCQIPYEDLCSLSDPYVANGFARVANSTYVKELTVDLAQQAWDAVMDVISKTSAKGSYVIFELGHFAKMASVPVGATAYAQRINSPLALIQVEYPKDVAGSVAEAEELVNKIKGAIDLAASTSETEGYGYPLFSDVISRVTDTDKYAKGIFGINYPRLQQVKAKYDPNMVFNKWFPIRPSA
ncbi:hypothetical protein FRC03_010290 [Tulasnella sp. 419]|nr:hypothetical protein FRC03_010290 [Tulasnella sp. 419]